MEMCSKELTETTKEFSIMYTLDGELLESIDEVEKDCDVILVSDDKF